jgi:hypothetical protein
MTDKERVWAVQMLLQEVDISEGKMPTYRGVPLTEFTRDDLIRIISHQMQDSEAHEIERTGRLL